MFNFRCFAALVLIKNLAKTTLTQALITVNVGPFIQLPIFVKNMGQKTV